MNNQGHREWGRRGPGTSQPHIVDLVLLGTWIEELPGIALWFGFFFFFWCFSS
jgi:hypothetical protein